MADDNVIGMRAELDLSGWTPSQKQLEAALAHVNSIIDSATKKAQENAKRVADAEKQSADTREKANKKISDSADAHSKKQSQALDRTVGKFRSAAYLITGLATSLVLVYKKLGDAATEFGDTEAIAKFDAMDASIKVLEDTVLAAGLEFEKTANLVGFFTGIVTTATQAVALLAGGLAYLAESQRITSAGVAGLGIEDLGKPENFAKVQAVQADAEKRALAARNAAIMGVITAPERSAATTRAAEVEKEANKQREKTAQSIVDYNAKIREITIKSGESILEAESDYHTKSAEAWASYMDEVEDITAKGISKRAELARDYSDKITVAETDYQRAIEDANYQHDKKLVDIERDYQRTIQSVQQTYQEDSLDAIRNLDAIALIRAKEKRDKDLANAETSRNDANAAESENYSRQLYEAQRAFEDKRREAEIAYQRGLEEQKRAEAEALQEAKNAYNQQTTDARNAYNEKLRTIQQAYNNENAAAQAQYGYSEAAYRDHLQRMQAITAAYGIGAATSTRGTGTLHRRQEGGLDIVSSPTQFLAGEAGPEMVYTAPLNRSVPVMTPQIVEHTGDFQHSIDSTIRSSVAGMDGRIVAAVSKVLREVLG